MKIVSFVRRTSFLIHMYVVKSVSNVGMKMTLPSTLPTNTVTNISPNGMKVTLSKARLLV